MPDKQPTFTVTFKELAVSAIKRQARGHVVMVLTSAQAQKTYKQFSEVKKEDYSENDYLNLELCFMGMPNKVTVLTKEEEISDLTKKLDKINNYTLVFPDAQSSDMTAIKTYLKTQRDKNNYSVAIFANGNNLDCEYIINFVSQNITIVNNNKTVEVSAANYTSRVAGALSGLPSSRALTYYELDEVVDCTLSEDEDSEVQKGNLVIIHQDDTYKFGRAVNSLVTTTDGISESFKKIRIVNIMDMIANDIVTTFRTNYVGKYVNNYANKKRFIGAVNTYLKGLENEGLLEEANDNEIKLSYEKIKAYIEAKGQSTENMSYQDIITYNTGSSVIVEGVCSPTDCMEDLNLGFYLFQALEGEV